MKHICYIYFSMSIISMTFCGPKKLDVKSFVKDGKIDVSECEESLEWLSENRSDCEDNSGLFEDLNNQCTPFIAVVNAGDCQPLLVDLMNCLNKLDSSDQLCEVGQENGSVCTEEQQSLLNCGVDYCSANFFDPNCVTLSSVLL